MSSYNPYEILQVRRTASDKDIKVAYLRLARITHPDKGGKAEEFGRVDKAYKLLKDPIARGRFDQFGITPDMTIDDFFNPSGDSGDCNITVHYEVEFPVFFSMEINLEERVRIRDKYDCHVDKVLRQRITGPFYPGKEIRFPNKGHYNRSTGSSGDLIIRLQAKPSWSNSQLHDRSNILMKHRLPLKCTIFGFTFQFVHPIYPSHVFSLSYSGDLILKDGIYQVKILTDPKLRGLPNEKGKRGKLLLQIEIDYPSKKEFIHEARAELDWSDRHAPSFQQYPITLKPYAPQSKKQAVQNQDSTCTHQ